MNNQLSKWMAWSLVIVSLLSSSVWVTAENADVAAVEDVSQYKTLAVGYTGPEVAALKQRMFELGYFKTNTVNESFTSNTAEYIKKFEEMNGLPVDGVADPEMQALFFSDKARRADGSKAVTVENTSKSKDILPGSEEEKKIAENIVGFLKAESPHTDEEIKSELFTGPGKIVDLGLIKNGNDIQGRFLGYLETEDTENLLLFIGLKDRNKDRFVTALRLALYMCEDESVPYVFYFSQLNGRSIIGGRKKRFELRDKKEITHILDSIVGENIVADLITHFSSGDKGALVNKSHIRFVEEIDEIGVNVSRSLTYDSFSNGIRLDYRDPRKKVFMIKEGSDDEITSILLDLEGDNTKVVNVPIIPAIFYK